VGALALAGAALSTPTASANADLAAKSNCLGCHHATQRRAGPPFQAIARRHAAALQDAKLREATVVVLARKIRQGGRGAWGVVPMPANPQVSDADARTLATWILEAHP
jgi:cytochrome c